MKLYTLLLLILTVGWLYCDDMKTRCKKKTKYFGCFYNPSVHKCLCKTRRACEFPFKYKNQVTCEKDIMKVKGACKRFPCRNGVCQPMKKMSKFRCNCSKSGFYGKRCHKPCPINQLSPDWLQQYIGHKHWQNTPLACIM